jgi:hypothetical protein
MMQVNCARRRKVWDYTNLVEPSCEQRCSSIATVVSNKNPRSIRWPFVLLNCEGDPTVAMDTQGAMLRRESLRSELKIAGRSTINSALQ